MRQRHLVSRVLPSLGQALVAWKMMGKVHGLITLSILPQNKYRNKYCNMLLSMLKNNLFFFFLKKKVIIKSKTREEPKYGSYLDFLDKALLSN